MNDKLSHISICICTYKRPDLLKMLLIALEGQTTDGLFTYSVVVADNDYSKTAKNVVSSFAFSSSLELAYCVEPRKNIALARNTAIKNAKGDYIAFIDDDEIPIHNWLYWLFITCNTLNVAGVLGPVRPYFIHPPPLWVRNGNFFGRPEHPTGYILEWTETRTGNVLFKREILEGISDPFREEFGSGSEDVDFFRRMIKKGHIFAWCNEASVKELIPSDRCKRSYQIKLALLRGGNSLKHKDQLQFLAILKSLVAMPIYIFSLPLLYLFGDHFFMKYLVAFFDHAGKILSLLGINPIKARE